MTAFDVFLYFVMFLLVVLFFRQILQFTLVAIVLATATIWAMILAIFSGLIMLIGLVLGWFGKA